MMAGSKIVFPSPFCNLFFLDGDNDDDDIIILGMLATVAKCTGAWEQAAREKRGQWSGAGRTHVS